MSKSKQATLFQSWGQKKKEPCDGNKIQSGIGGESSHGTGGDDIIDLCLDEDDDDDDLLAQALEESIIDPGGKGSFINMDICENTTNYQVPSTSAATEADMCNISIGAEIFSCTQGLTQTNAPEGFDKSAGKLWIYPTNYPVREYQFSIVQQSLYKNTMVTLPTGLGKTFIASVIMYNFYRWYPLGKVVFMAPTKPLVAQQIEACYNIMGIPQKDTAEMTGTMPPQERRKAWHDKRVFFLTPQVLTNDLSRGTCPAILVKCLVVDEAHKALGNHAYCQVVRELVKYTRDFRILALSATPGSDIKAVQQVLANLLISHIEIRTEDSPDIKQYSHERKVEKIVVPLGDELTLVKTKYLQIIDIVVNRLKRQGVIYNRDTKSLSKFLILKAREAFRQNPPERVQRSHFGIVEGDFALAMSLFHGYELLQLHGLRSLYNFLDGIVSGEKGHGRTRTELMKNADFISLMEMLQMKFVPLECRPSQASQNSKKPFVTGHPKMEKLQEVVLEHFDKFQKDDRNKGRQTRIMIFSQYRDSVTEIKDMLKQHYPVVKVMSFIGQSSAGKATKGFTQKEQLKVMKEFRDGGYNTLVSTCVGEEGLDIGEVDLIICFDAHKSPIRLVQRMGRTGRKREGRIVMLVTQGKEEQIYNQSQYSKRSIHKAILNGAKSLNFYQCNPRMVPDGWDPPCHKMFITVKETFKPAKRSTESDGKNKITNMIGNKSAATSVGEGLLTEDQYNDWKENYSVPEDQMKKLKSSSKFLSLCSTDKEEPDEVNDGESFLSLSKWLPWQNQQQPAYVMGHSERSKHLVEIVEFIELQQALDPNEDNYGQEMELFLNEEDVVKLDDEIENTEAGKITKFLTAGIVEHNDIKAANKKRIRRSDLLQDFESDKELQDSDDDLPVVCFDSTVIDKSKCQRETTNEQQVQIQQGETVADQAEHSKELEQREITFKENKNHSEKGYSEIDESGFKSGINRIKRKSTKKFLENKNAIKVKTLGEDNQKKQTVRKTKKDKKKRYSSGNSTVVQIIADNDGNDFDGFHQVPNTSVSMDTEDIKRKFEEKSQKVDISTKDEQMTEEENVESNTSDMEVGVCDQVSNKNDVVEDSFSQLLPHFNERERLARRKSRSDSGSSTDYRIPTPPSIQEMEVMINSLGNKKMLPSIDLVELVEEWEKEKLFSKKLSTTKKISADSNINEYNVDLNCSGLNVNMQLVNVDNTAKMSVSVHSVQVTAHQNQLETYRTLSNMTVKENPQNKNESDDVHDRVDQEKDSITLNKIENPELKDSDHENNDESRTFMELGERLSNKFDKGKLDRISSDSDDDVFVDTQANFNLAENDDFLTDLIVEKCTSGIKSGSSNTDSSSVASVNDTSDTSRSKHISSECIVDNVEEKPFSNIIGEVNIDETSKSKKSLFKLSPASRQNDRVSVLAFNDEISNLKSSSTNHANSKFKYQTSTSAVNLKENDKYRDQMVDSSRKLMEENLSDSEINLKESRTVVKNNTSGQSFIKPNEKFVVMNDLQNNECSEKISLNIPCKQIPGQSTNTSASLFDDSLFKDDMYDDDFPLAVKTPKPEFMEQIAKTGLESMKKQRLGPNEGLESQVTFTQALACVHSSSEASSADDVHEMDVESNKVLTLQVCNNQAFTERRNSDIDLQNDPVNNTTADLKKKSKSLECRGVKTQIQEEIIKHCHTKGDNDHYEDGDDEDEDLPTFDLGFNIDEDIIPPSPCTSQSFSQKSFSKCLSQSMLRSRKSLSSRLSSGDGFEEKNKEGRRNSIDIMQPVVEENSSSMLIDDDFENDFKGIKEDQDTSEEDNTNHSKPISDINANDSSEREMKSHPPQEDIGLSLGDNLGKGVSLHAKQNVGKNEAFDDIVDFDHLEEGPSSPILSGRRACSQKHSPTTPSLDDSFVVRKKRRVTIIDSPDSPEPGSTGMEPEQNEVEFKTPRRPVVCRNKTRKNKCEDLDDFMDDVKVKDRRKLSVSFNQISTCKIIDDDGDEDSDFQDCNIETSNIGNKKARFKSVCSNGSKKGSIESKSKDKGNHFTGIKKKSKSPAEMFIVGEADVSDEEDVHVSEDEADDSDLDHMEDSFIHEGTQPSQECTEDMHAIYLKSVRSPAAGRGGGRFKLQYKHAAVDVFSQAPRGEEEEESQYMDDSFCVDDDYEETYVDIDEEVELCKDLDETTYIGRRTRWSKPVKRTDKKVLKSDKSKKRIKIMVDSSSDEETNKVGSVPNIILSPKESSKSSMPLKPRKRQILSSSDDEVTNNNNYESSPEVMLSLKSRISKFATNAFSSDIKNRLDLQGSKPVDDNLKEQYTNNESSEEVMLSLKSRISKSGNSALNSVLKNQSETLSSKTNATYTDLKHLTISDKCFNNKSEVKVDTCDTDRKKEERLRRQKEKQEEFRRKMAEKQKLIENKSSDNGVGVVDKSNKSGSLLNKLCADLNESSQSTSSEILVNVSCLQSKDPGKLVILVDSKELSGAQDIVSDLRFVHNCHVVAAQLLGCDYVVSNRMGVDRKQWSEFSNGANKNKLIERIQYMYEIYDRPCLLIERDRIKGEEKEGSRPLHWTKYVDRTLVQLIKSKVALYFTETQKETAAILAELSKLEQRKNLSISVPTDLSLEKQQQAKFYCSFPKLAYIHSLNLCYNFKSVAEFLSSSIIAIRNKGKMSEQRATEVYNYIRRTFDTQMLPTSYG